MVGHYRTFAGLPSARELKIADVEDGRQELTELCDEARGQTDNLEGLLETVESMAVIGTLPPNPALKVPIVVDIAELEMGFFFSCGTEHEVVKHVEVSLAGRRCLRNARPFKVVLDGLEPVQPTSIVKL